MFLLALAFFQHFAHFRQRHHFVGIERMQPRFGKGRQYVRAREGLFVSRPLHLQHIVATQDATICDPFAQCRIHVLFVRAVHGHVGWLDEMREARRQREKLDSLLIAELQYRLGKARRMLIDEQDKGTATRQVRFKPAQVTIEQLAVDVARICKGNKREQNSE